MLTTATFDSKQMNRAAVVEIALAVLVPGGRLPRLRNTIEINTVQLLRAVVPARGPLQRSIEPASLAVGACALLW